MVETLHEPPRLLPPVELPPYTFIPGSTTPHPYRHPDGHSYKKKGPSAKPLSNETWADNRSFLMAFTMLTAFTIIYLGIHWIVDIIGGMVVGIRFHRSYCYVVL